MTTNQPQATTMTEKNTTQFTLAIPDEVITALSDAAKFGSEQIDITDNFRRAAGVATAIQRMRAILTPQVMSPFMELQNSTLGFLTDVKGNGYPVDVVRDCMIQAAIENLSIYGNEFNIISGRLYVTKNGLKNKLKNECGLKFHATPGTPRAANEKGAIVPVHLEWTQGGKKQTADLDFPVRINAGMGVDALKGKSERKALAWLYEEVTGNAVDDGEIGDEPIDITPLQSPLENARPREEEDDALEAM